MSVNAISEYHAEPKDRVENFNGMQLLYVYWPKHLMFCAPFALLVAPDMTFGAFVDELLKPAVAGHPDSGKADFLNAQWLLNDEAFTPDPAASLIDNGIDHKSMLTVTTSGLEGIQGSAS
ncbi:MULTISPECIES: phenol hydroxylase subunit P4 [Marinobacter]|uniref:Phenol hydroxylase subunit P4 n=1 Tax=Marinobacter xiaoshiensis TaxID=3073652 RepID=A0ABU2HDV8_9GAMM|nr:MULTISPECIES: phenol hydroxylase subunit P4 [unclassified Marinobacter]MBK1887177.1 phenol hydroxylase subunit P4 [Marinobacter sp. DY40_1A1]MDS1308746.1 phenol hydroxylase subunit P4 [Marinobacter sp. F60267]